LAHFFTFLFFRLGVVLLSELIPPMGSDYLNPPFSVVGSSGRPAQVG
jgi:hypothetical protein